MMEISNFLMTLVYVGASQRKSELPVVTGKEFLNNKKLEESENFYILQLEGEEYGIDNRFPDFLSFFNLKNGSYLDIQQKEDHWSWRWRKDIFEDFLGERHKIDGEIPFPEGMPDYVIDRMNKLGGEIYTDKEGAHFISYPQVKEAA
jgi:hypothetical protein